jgi:HAD superfamily hydrolase (TIGR01490 family)
MSPCRAVQGPTRTSLWTTRAQKVTVEVPRSERTFATYHGGMAGSRLSAVPSRARHASGQRSAAFFDLDKTIIAKSSSLAFSKPFQAGGLITRGAMLRSAYAQFVYLVGGADHDQMEKIRAFMSQLVEGWDVETVKEIVAETLHHVVDPIVYDEAVSLMEEHREAGRDVVVVSASGAEVVEPIGEMLGADDVIASRLEIVDGRYTGEIDYYAYAEEKALAIGALAEERGYDLEQCFAYSDSITDAPMLEIVGHPHAVNPDKELRKLAAAKGWPVLQFSRPVTLRSRIPVKPTLAALAAGTALTVGGAIWLNRRRKLA